MINQTLIRRNIRELKPYSSARLEWIGKDGLLLDANENSFGSPIDKPCNRYPDPLQTELKEKISAIKDVPTENIFIGNGSDEAIDLIIRATCTPGRDNLIIMPPTYGMYRVAAEINDVAVRSAPLTSDFSIDRAAVAAAIDRKSKIIFACSPNNPTGNCLARESLLQLARRFPGLLVVDEAYIDFADMPSLVTEISEYENLVVLQTLSKAWGLAGLRVGPAFASKEIIRVLNNIKHSYNVSSLNQEAACTALSQADWKSRAVQAIISERAVLEEALRQLTCVLKVYPSNANFLLVRFKNARAAADRLREQSIIVRDRSTEPGCEECLRITVGTAQENKKLLDTLRGCRL